MRPRLGIGQEQRRPRADDDARPVVRTRRHTSKRSPSDSSLCKTVTRPGKAGGKAVDGLGRQRDLRHQDDGLRPALSASARARR